MSPFHGIINFVLFVMDTFIGISISLWYGFDSKEKLIMNKIVLKY